MWASKWAVTGTELTRQHFVEEDSRREETPGREDIAGWPSLGVGAILGLWQRTIKMFPFRPVPRLNAVYCPFETSLGLDCQEALGVFVQVVVQKKSVRRASQCITVSEKSRSEGHCLSPSQRQPFM